MEIAFVGSARCGPDPSEGHVILESASVTIREAVGHSLIVLSASGIRLNWTDDGSTGLSGFEFSPGYWWLSGECEALRRFYEKIKRDSPSTRIHERTDGYRCLVVGGYAAADVISAGCVLDFGAPVAAKARWARTLVAGCRVILCHESPTSFRISVERSLADYLCAWLAEIAESVDLACRNPASLSVYLEAKQ